MLCSLLIFFSLCLLSFKLSAKLISAEHYLLFTFFWWKFSTVRSLEYPAFVCCIFLFWYHCRSDVFKFKFRSSSLISSIACSHSEDNIPFSLNLDIIGIDLIRLTLSSWMVLLHLSLSCYFLSWFYLIVSDSI